MKTKQILKAIKALAENEKLGWKLKNEAYDEGWEEGYESGLNDSEQYSDGYKEGWESKKANNKVRLEMLMDTYMNTGKGTKVIFIKEIIEYLDYEYDPIKAEEDYNRMMEDF